MNDPTRPFVLLATDLMENRAMYYTRTDVYALAGEIMQTANAWLADHQPHATWDARRMERHSDVDRDIALERTS